MLFPIVSGNQGNCFINPYPLTKKGIQRNNRRITHIYTNKRGAALKFDPTAKKTEGCAFGTIFTKTSTPPSSKRWVGKIGDSTRSLVERYTTTFKEINLDVICEKLSYDLYEELGRGFFRLPKSRLSELPMVNQFGPDKPRWEMGDYIYTFIDKNRDKSSLRIMSQYMEGYCDFKKAETSDENGKLSFLDFIKKWHRPPDHLITPQGKKAPLKGLIELIAVGRVLADTDILGGDMDNAGFVWIYEDDTIIAAESVKIDPGKGLNLSCHEEETTPSLFNWVWNTIKNLPDGIKLYNVKDIQIAQNCKTVTLLWEKFTPEQQEIFLGVLFNSSRYLKAPNVLDYLFYRDGQFHKSAEAELPKTIADRFQKEMKEWLTLQRNIYREDLAFFHQKYPEQALRAHYIDSCSELSLSMKEETFPIHELFTELVIVDGKQKETGHKTLSAYLPEVDSFKETTDRLELFSHTIALENLFNEAKRVLLIGRAGIGKSTLCQKIAHDWAAGKLWNQMFETLYWIPLRKFNDLKIGADFLTNQALPHLFSHVETLDHLCQELGSKKTLLILDGYDEANPELAQLVQQLLKEAPFHILLTSRPGQLEELEIDQIVENIGFSDQQIQTYINRFSKRHEENFTEEKRGNSLFKTIKENPHLYPIAHVPLQLQMIVSLYENQKDLAQASSLTKLYQFMIEELYAWNLPGKKLGGGQKLEERDAIFKTLGEIAFIGLQHGKLIIPHKKISYFLSDSLIIDSLLKTGILKKIEGEKKCYQFMHLTFQEFLAALYISQKSIEKQRTFILENRDKPSYQLALIFLIGLNSSKKERVQDFFATLYKQSSTKTLSTPYLLELTLRCLNECEGFLDPIAPIDALIKENPQLWETCLSDGCTPIFSAAHHKQTQALKWLGTCYPELLQKTEKPPKKNKHYSVLSTCADKGDLEAVKWLLQTDSTLIKKYTTDGRTPLHFAAVEGHVEVVKLLLEADPSLISKYTKDGKTSLHYAAFGGHVEVIKLLLQEDPQIISSATEGFTPLHMAAQGGHVGVIKLLLQEDPSLMSKYTKDGKTSLHCAASGGHVEVIKLLLQEDSHIISKYMEKGRTPLYSAAYNGHIEVIRLLLQADPQLIKKYTTDGITPLHLAVSGGHVEVAKLLLQADPSLISKYTKDRRTPLHVAAEKGHIEVIRLLLQADPQLISKYTKERTTPLHYAAYNGDIEVIRLLLQADPQLISKYTKERTTPLHYAAFGGHVEVVKLLLEADPSLISKYTKDHRTPLHVAAEKGHIEVIKLLLQVDPRLFNLRDKNGLTPIDIAQDNEQKECVKWLNDNYPDKDDCNII